MSPVTQVRTSVFYVMLATIVLLMVVNTVGGIFLRDTRQAQETTTKNLLIGCERANRSRNMQHWLATNSDPRPPIELLAGLTLDTRESPQAGRPWLVNCAAAYP